MESVMWWRKFFSSGNRGIIDGIKLILCLLVGIPQVFGQRTVDVVLEPLSRPNICGDRDVAITIGLNTPLYVSDSLLLFEFAIAYDPSKLQFVAPLFAGTLAENAEYSGSGRVDSATVRVYAFNVTHPFRGQGPLCGLLFRYRGQCPDTTSVTIAQSPEKNIEAKIEFGTVRAASVQSLELPVSNRSLTAQFPNDTIQILRRQETAIPIVVTVPPEIALSKLTATITADSGVSLRRVTLIRPDTLQLDTIEITEQSWKVQIASLSRLPAQAIELSCIVEPHANSTVGRVWIALEHPPCACVASAVGDSTLIVVEQSSGVSVNQEQLLMWRLDPVSLAWELCGPTESVTALMQWDQLGRLIVNHVWCPSEPIRLSAESRWSAVVLFLQNGTMLRTVLVR
ncbi:MAG: hypothetical protein N2663_08095 [Chlorobi bacterium]|nr:hypothetical protein [Chlorobiota bacterium]